MVLWQLIVNGLAAAGSFALVGLGFVIIYRVVKFIHFSHAFVFVTGAYSALVLRDYMGVPACGAVILAVAVCGTTGLLIDRGAYRWLGRKGASPLVMLLCSLGVYVALQGVTAIVFGSEPVTLRTYTVPEGIWLFGARVSLVQSLTVVTAIGVALILRYVYRSRYGIAMRGLASDADLAEVSGVDSDQVRSAAFFLGSALAGCAGILVCYDSAMTPSMGMVALLMGAIAAIIGGGQCVAGVLIGAVTLGLAQHLAVWRISSEWKDAIAFAVLLSFLLLRPQGVMGKKVSKATV